MIAAALLGLALTGWAQGLPTPSFLFTWGIVGQTGGQFLFPSGLAVDAQGFVYVTDIAQHRVQVFDAQGQFVRQWGSRGSASGQFEQPHDVAVDAQGFVYVSDGNNGRIQQFDADGAFLASWGRLGAGRGEFSMLRGLGTDAEGNVYAADAGHGRVQVFDPQGRLVRILGSDTLKRPFDVAVDAQGFVYVVEFDAGTVVKFSPDGERLASWGGPGRAPGQLNTPRGIAIDPRTGNVFVSDSGHHRVTVFSPQGQVLGGWGHQCHLSSQRGCVDPDGAGPLRLGDGQFLNPRGLGVSPQGIVYVTDTFNHRVEAFGHF